jgi:glycosyltransferase involved in cell wall biosynthesis
MKARIGYLLPEFPGQTHIFFWRERGALTELGIDTVLISTRRPPKAIASHTWASEAEQQTTYLVPFSWADAGSAIEVIWQAGPRGWWRCLTAIAKAKDTPLKQRLRLFALVLVAGKLVALAKAQNWHHVHIHSCADAANIGLFAALLSDLTYSLTLHGPTLEVYGPNQAQKWEQAAFALVISKTLDRDIHQKLAGHLPQQVAIAPMGVNLDEIRRQTPYTPPAPDQVCKLFSCGRLNPVKGHAYLIQAIAQLRQRGFNVQLEIAGEDEQGGTGYHRELDQVIQDLALSDTVKLLGAVSEARIRQGLEAAHLFTLASLNEGVPVAVMEAMAMEVPIVVTNVGGTWELVDNGVDGILVESENAEVMADAIAQVLQDPDLALRLSQASRQKVSTQFHHRRSAEVLAQCILASA